MLALVVVGKIWGFGQYYVRVSVEEFSKTRRLCWTNLMQIVLYDVPIVGMVVTISPSFSLYKIVVFPAASRPTIRMRISFFPHNLSKSFENVRPILLV